MGLDNMALTTNKENCEGCEPGEDCCSYTLFHPTGEAIRKFVQYWVRAGKPLTKHYLHNIAKYHVLNGTVYTKDLAQGSNVLETVMDSPTYVNRGEQGAQVINFLNNKVGLFACLLSSFPSLFPLFHVI